MSSSAAKYAMRALYLLGGALLAWLLLTFIYQYIALLGFTQEVLGAWQDRRILSALWLSLTSSFATLFFSLLFGIPLGYLFALKEFKGKVLMETLSIDVPQTFPPIAEGMIYLLLLGPHSPLHINLAFTFSALVIAKFYVCAPFIVSFVARRFREIQETKLPLTARTLGANPLHVFMLIFLPLSFKEIAAGTSLCWARAMGELGGSLIFAGVIAYQTEIIPTFIAKEAQSLPGQALAATILVTSASTLSLLLFKFLTRRR